MKLNPQSGNMYAFVTHTGNAIRGVCPHDCVYCYMKKWKLPKLYLNRGELQGGLRPDPGQDGFIFVGSSVDMFARAVPDEDIEDVLEYCCRHSEPRYLFQSKNSRRLHQFKDSFPSRVVLGTTIETNRFYEKFMGDTPEPEFRASGMAALHQRGFETMLTVEPIMSFDLEELVELIVMCSPSWVNVGADSQEIGLPEPSEAEVKELIGALTDAGLKVHRKDNLHRILKRDTALTKA